jgi:nicotinate dehydrogenase subunit B
MPAFKDHLGDEQLAELIAYLRKQFAPGRPEWTDIPDVIDRIRPSQRRDQ